LGRGGAVVAARAKAHANARATLERTHPPHQHAGTKDAIVLDKARGEIDDRDRVVACVEEAGLKHRRVVPVELLRPFEPQKRDLVEAVIGLVTAEQRAKGGVAVEIWQARPDDPAALVDQGAVAAISDYREVEVGWRHA